WIGIVVFTCSARYSLHSVFLFFFYFSVGRARVIHSFPTRRSSDLRGRSSPARARLLLQRRVRARGRVRVCGRGRRPRRDRGESSCSASLHPKPPPAPRKGLPRRRGL